MRETKGSVSHIAQAIEEDLKSRDSGLQKPHIPALADLAASVLICRSVNTSEWRSIWFCRINLGNIEFEQVCILSPKTGRIYPASA